MRLEKGVSLQFLLGPTIPVHAAYPKHKGNRSAVACKVIGKKVK